MIEQPVSREVVVSVVMPVYQAEAYVYDAIKSILDQTFQDFELIVVDDASTDRSLEIIRTIDDTRIRVLQQPENAGYPSAMNRGLEIAQGSYIARMDADDVCEPVRLATQLSFLQSNPEYVFVGSLQYWVTPNGKKSFSESLQKSMQNECMDESWESVLEGTRRFVDSSVLVRHHAVKKVGGYRTYQRSGQDVDLWLRLLEDGGKAATLGKPLYGRRLVPSSITFSMETKARNRIPRILAMQRKETGSDAVMRGEDISYLINQEGVEGSKKWRHNACWRAAITCAEVGDLPGSIGFLVQALRHQPLSLDNLVNFFRYLKRCRLRVQ